MVFLPPGERIDGTVAECAHLHLLLACFRASPPPMRLPEVTGCPLPDLLGAGPTRNLGILMEGATDAEATAIARQTAESCGIVVEDPELGMTSLALADATGVPVHVAAEPEGAARGAAFLARLAGGLERELNQADRWARTSHVVEPDPRWLGPVADRYHLFVELSDALQPRLYWTNG